MVPKLEKYEEKHDDQYENEILDVIIVVSNPVCYKRRYQLFEEFKKRYQDNPDIRLHATELQQGNKPYMTSAQHKLRTKHEIWHKENLINLTVQKLPLDWKYMAWIDADIEFHNENWARETINSLQHYKIVQLFSHAIDMGPNDEAFGVYTSFGYDFCRNQKFFNRLNYKNHYHTGYAWAITRRCFNKIGGLIDFAILGSADAHMAYALIHKVNLSYNRGVHKNYKKLLDIFEKRCMEYINLNIGYVKGTILHHFHGKKKDRQYVNRWKILVKHQFDPLNDIFKDAQGLYQLSQNKCLLRNAIKLYFRSRNEDSIDLE